MRRYLLGFQFIQLGDPMSTQQGDPDYPPDFAETLHICPYKLNLKVLKISSSKIKRFQKYWHSKLDLFYNFLKQGLET